MLAAFWFNELRIIYEITAEKGNFESMSKLGELWLSNDLGEVDYHKALTYLRAAAKSEMPEHLYNLGIALIKDNTAIENKEKGSALIEQAIEIWKKEVTKRDSDAARDIAEIYYYGDLGVPNYEEAIKWFVTAMDLGYIKAKYYLAKIYLVRLVEKDINVATDYIKQIADENIDIDITTKAVSLLSYLSTQENQPQGLEWLTTLVLQGQALEEMLARHDYDDHIFSPLQQEAMWQISKYYLNQEYQQANYSEAMKWLKLLSFADYERAIEKLNQLAGRDKPVLENGSINTIIFDQNINIPLPEVECWEQLCDVGE